MTETQEQIRVIKWSQQPSIRSKFPELKLLFHVPNESKDAIERKQKLMMGMKRGVPDLCLPVPRGKYHGLYLEMKNDTGRTSDAQEWWGEALLNQGYMWEVCHGWTSAVKTLEWYLRLNNPPCAATRCRTD